MSDNVKMLLRYLVTILVSCAVGKGWIIEQGGAVTNTLIEIGGVLIAALPPLYAAFFVSFAPKTS